MKFNRLSYQKLGEMDDCDAILPEHGSGAWQRSTFAEAGETELNQKEFVEGMVKTMRSNLATLRQLGIKRIIGYQSYVGIICSWIKNR